MNIVVEKDCKKTIFTLLFLPSINNESRNLLFNKENR